MSQNICEYLREQSIQELFKMHSFSTVWPSWKTDINEKLSPINPSNIINLGDQLSAVFKSTSSGRNQSSVSAGGNIWEALICWYLNLCLIGTRAVVIKHKKNLVPIPVRKSMVVNYGNFPSNTESDLIAIIFPDLPEYTADKIQMDVHDESGNLVPLFKRNNKFNYEQIINVLTSRDFDRLVVGIIQCKTNWNDNAQIPMLWDIVYSSGRFRRNNINIGVDGFSIQGLKEFSYSFITVPSNNVPFNPSSTPVQRVNYLSGGNYWGRPSQLSVSRSVKEIFNNNFEEHLSQSIRQSLRSNLSKLTTVYSYFDII